ncbi:MAG: 50S ribosomal protein L6 [Eubacteriales bacterium]|nr:50S ribosomal protein L6 [Eubacteriales bacterium]
MSRIGRKPIAIPAGVTVTVADDNTVTVKGPKGTLSQWVNPNITVTQEGAELVLTRCDDQKENRAKHGLYRNLIANMVTGVTEGYSKELNIVGTGYRVALAGKKLTINIGFSHPVEYTAPEGISFDVPAPNRIIVSGIDKQLVGETSAQIRRIKEPEPYMGKGIRYLNEVVRHKEGKTAGK